MYFFIATDYNSSTNITLLLQKIKDSKHPTQNLTAWKQSPQVIEQPINDIH